MKQKHSIQAWAILVASVLIQAVLGRVYAWSGIGKALRADYGFSSFQTELIFGFSIGVFALGTLVTGRLVHRVGPRLLALASGLLYGLVHVIAANSGGDFPTLLIALGPVMGIAIAMGYVCPLSVAVQWFPKHKGLVTGLAVAGFGAGAILDGSITQVLASQGLDLLQRLLTLGLPGAGLIMLSALVMDFPPQVRAKTLEVPSIVPESHKQRAHLPDIRLQNGSIFSTPLFWSLAFAMFAGTAGGLVVIGKAMSIADEFGLPEYGTLAVSLIALGNAGGRMFWGWVMDRLGSKTILIAMGVGSVAMLALAFSQGNGPLFLLAATATGMQFGASLVLFAAFCEKYYGPGAIARVYPFIFIWYGLAAVLAPPLGGLLHDSLQSFVPTIVVASIIPILGLVVLYMGLGVISQHRSAIIRNEV